MLQPLRLDQPLLRTQERQTLPEFPSDLVHRALQSLAWRYVVRLGVNRDARDAAAHFAGQRIEVADILDFVVEELYADRFPLGFGREHVENVAAHPERALPQFRLVAGVLQVRQASQQLALIDPVAPHEVQDHLEVGVRIAQAVDRGNGGHHDRVLAFHERLGRRQPHLFDVLVDRCILLDIGVGGRHVRFGLVVVVIGNEVLDPIFRKEVPELAVKLGGQRLVGRQHQRRALLPGHDAGQRIGLAGTGHAQQRLARQTGVQALAKPIHGLRLIARQLEVGLQLKSIRTHPGTLAPLRKQRRFDPAFSSLPSSGRRMNPSMELAPASCLQYSRKKGARRRLREASADKICAHDQQQALS